MSRKGSVQTAKILVLEKGLTKLHKEDKRNVKALAALAKLLVNFMDPRLCRVNLSTRLLSPSTLF